MKTFKERYNRVLRNHRINWNREEVTENGFGLPLDDDDGVLNESWQFSISRNKHGRVHGFIIDNIFYIVWLDPEHNLDIGKNGEVTEIKESPRAKLLEELFSGEDREIYLQNTNVIDKMVLAYEEECNNCDLELERLWYNCVICNESDEDNLLKWNGVNVCYDCLKEMKNLDIEESA
ncbi:hypothetical protein [Sporohalobacter salinus]|uniref:hypothetical protein n=1 Tax=Sporohalobacter salinus TaxID=1494606 RepID=UPI0019606B8E|nr:hypothetical protein [Sporohalobacter salinus]MBM7624797.1 hypothetical protein [Sporohalobacter salinus]